MSYDEKLKDYDNAIKYHLKAIDIYNKDFKQNYSYVADTYIIMGDI